MNVKIDPARQSFNCIIGFITDNKPGFLIHSELEKIANEIRGHDVLKTTILWKKIVQILKLPTQNEDEKKQLISLAHNLFEVFREMPAEMEPISRGKKYKPAKQSIIDHNQKALAALPKDGGVFEGYPFSKLEKREARMIRNNEQYCHKIKSESKKLHSCATQTASSQGYRKSMQDRSLASAFDFHANGKVRRADLFAVLDGHGGETTVDYVKDNLLPFLKKRLESRLIAKEPSEEDIYVCLKRVIEELHEEVIANGYTDGTTAIVGFKLADSNELYTANIGDSSAYINRRGAVIPMSIEQKALYFEDESARHQEIATFEKPNEYARQLEKAGVVIYEPNKGMESKFRQKELMTMSYDETKKGVHMMVLGILGMAHLEPARTIGDPFYEDEWKKFTPEIFKQVIQPGDQLILHSDGVKAAPQAIVNAVENDRVFGFCSAKDTAECIVQFSMRSGDNICVTIVSFGSPKEEFLSALDHASSTELRKMFEALEERDKNFYALLCSNALIFEHYEWLLCGRAGTEPKGDNFGKNLIFSLLADPIAGKKKIFEFAGET